MAEYTLSYTASEIDSAIEKMINGAADSVDWSNMTNRPFGEEVVAVEIYPENTHEGFAMNSDYNAHIFNINPDPFTLTVGNTYVVTWDGAEHECIAQDASSIIAGVVFLGNGSDYGLSGNNEPFVIGWGNGGVTLMALTDEADGGTHTLSIQEEKDIVYPLDNKYLEILEGKDGTVFFESDGVTFYEENGLYTARPETTEDVYNAWTEYSGQVKVVWDTKEYQTETAEYGDIKYVGNLAVQLPEEADTGEPFLIVVDYNGSTYEFTIISNDPVGEDTSITYNHAVTISTGGYEIKSEYLPDGVESAKPTAIDLTAYESDGIIVETYEDGSTITYTMEFDADGNPTKITDSNGNETVLTW